MPVRIIRRSAVPQEIAAPAKAVPVKSTGTSHVTIRKVSATAPVTNHSRGWEVGGGIVLLKHDLSFETGHTKFLLHRVKEKVWYRVRDFDPETNLISLTSQVKFDFACRLDAAFRNNYIVAMYPIDGATEPTIEMLTFVNRKLPKLLQTSSQAA